VQWYQDIYPAILDQLQPAVDFKNTNLITTLKNSWHVDLRKCVYSSSVHLIIMLSVSITFVCSDCRFRSPFADHVAHRDQAVKRRMFHSISIILLQCKSVYRHLVRQDLTPKCTIWFVSRETLICLWTVVLDFALKRLPASTTQNPTHNKQHANKHFNVRPNFRALPFFKQLLFLLYIVNWTKFAIPAVSTATSLDWRGFTWVIFNFKLNKILWNIDAERKVIPLLILGVPFSNFDLMFSYFLRNFWASHSPLPSHGHRPSLSKFLLTYYN
jgi:hypothetical protein